jgi:hypothetical protein
MRLILVGLLAIPLVMTASCTGSETNPSPTSSTIVASTITVPRVVGLDVDSAKRAIEDVGLP